MSKVGSSLGARGGRAVWVATGRVVHLCRGLTGPWWLRADDPAGLLWAICH